MGRDPELASLRRHRAPEAATRITKRSHGGITCRGPRRQPRARPLVAPMIRRRRERSGAVVWRARPAHTTIEQAGPQQSQHGAWCSALRSWCGYSPSTTSSPHSGVEPDCGARPAGDRLEQPASQQRQRPSSGQAAAEQRPSSGSAVRAFQRYAPRRRRRPSAHGCAQLRWRGHRGRCRSPPAGRGRRCFPGTAGFEPTREQQSCTKAAAQRQGSSKMSRVGPKPVEVRRARWPPHGRGLGAGAPELAASPPRLAPDGTHTCAGERRG